MPQPILLRVRCSFGALVSAQTRLMLRRGQKEVLLRYSCLSYLEARHNQKKQLARDGCLPCFISPVWSVAVETHSAYSIPTLHSCAMKDVLCQFPSRPRRVRKETTLES
eukprot:5566850-Amphidinium_carterae.1